MDHDVGVTDAPLGRVRTIVRYPVKSMAGEILASCHVDGSGLAGDRRFGVVDDETGRVASAKQPRRWAGLLDLHAAYAGEPAAANLRVTMPDGQIRAWTDPALTFALGALSGRAVRLVETPYRDAQIERFGTEFDQKPGVEDDLPIGRLSPVGSLFDLAPLHLIASSTLDALGDVRRFRPNLVIEDAGPAFVENTWINRTLRIGDTLTVGIIAATPRCVIPTLRQADLPGDPPLLRRINTANRVDVPLVGPSPCAGVYAIVLTPGGVETSSMVR